MSGAVQEARDELVALLNEWECDIIDYTQDRTKALSAERDKTRTKWEAALDALLRAVREERTREIVEALRDKADQWNPADQWAKAASFVAERFQEGEPK